MLPQEGMGMREVDGREVLSTNGEASIDGGRWEAGAAGWTFAHDVPCTVARAFFCSCVRVWRPSLAPTVSRPSLVVTRC